MSSFGCSVSHGLEQGFKIVELANKLVRTSLLPELGGKLWTLWHKPSSSQWLWHNPNVALKAASPGACYDDNWAGGWEELFPNDAPGEFMGRELPDHGEWWNQAWGWELAEESRERVSIHLWRKSTLTQTFCEKWVTLEDDTARVSIRYRMVNLSSEPLHFLFKQHLAVAVTPAHRLELPGGKMTPVDLEFSSRIGTDEAFEWPIAMGKNGQVVDLSILPPNELAHREFVYLYDLPAGWCGVKDPRTGVRLRLHFDREVFPYTWLFMTLGGWRELYTVVLEPCTNMPKDLNKAFSLGRCASLGPREVMTSEVYAEFGTTDLI